MHTIFNGQLYEQHFCTKKNKYTGNGYQVRLRKSGLTLQTIERLQCTDFEGGVGNSLPKAETGEGGVVVQGGGGGTLGTGYTKSITS